MCQKNQMLLKGYPYIFHCHAYNKVVGRPLIGVKLSKAVGPQDSSIGHISG